MTGNEEKPTDEQTPSDTKKKKDKKKEKEKKEKDPRGGRGRFQTTQDVIDQREGVGRRQDQLRKGKGGVIIDSITKSKQREKNALKQIQSLEDLLDNDNN